MRNHSAIHSTLCLIPLTLFLIASPCKSAEEFTIEVPGVFPTIQEAIDFSWPGAVIEIADGVYTGPLNRNLDFGGKAITVQSASGDPSLCIIDCQYSGRGFYFHSGEGNDSAVEGITITNGDVDSSSPGGDNGAGVHCRNSSPKFNNCIFRNNAEWSWRTQQGGECTITHLIRFY